MNDQSQNGDLDYVEAPMSPLQSGIGHTSVSGHRRDGGNAQQIPSHQSDWKAGVLFFFFFFFSGQTRTNRADKLAIHPPPPRLAFRAEPDNIFGRRDASYLSHSRARTLFRSPFPDDRLSNEQLSLSIRAEEKLASVAATFRLYPRSIDIITRIPHTLLVPIKSRVHCTVLYGTVQLR